MNTQVINKNGIDIAVLDNKELLIKDVQSALDLMASVRYETDCNCIVINKSAICEDFFDLKTRIAGEILQKFINYYFKIAIVGDFSIYSSKSLKDFIYESNNGNSIFFMDNIEQAVEKLGSVK